MNRGTSAVADDLGPALRDAVLALPWARHRGAVPSLDLAVAGFPEGAPPCVGNVLFSRERPQGHVAAIGPRGGAVRGLRFVADLRDGAGASIAWDDDADWARLRFPPLHGDAGPRFVAPYPASLAKLMVAVGVALAVDAGRCGWDTLQADRRRRVRALGDWCDAMITTSDNDATEAAVAALHRFGVIGPGRHELHELFAALGLTTLRLDGTTPDGGWRNADGAGVGRLQMTAWDTVRLLWWLDAQAPPAPWLEADVDEPAPTLSPASRSRLLGWLSDQALHTVLSSTALAGTAGWPRGLPARVPARWLDDATGAVHAGEAHFSADVRPAQAAAEVDFAHKTGGTENYASDAGIVRASPPRRRHYVVALLSTLGRRHAPPRAPASPLLALLGAAVDRLMIQRLEPAA